LQFMRSLETLDSRQQLARVVVDEAHCISEWGHDFRPNYRVRERCDLNLSREWRSFAHYSTLLMQKLSVLRDGFPRLPFLCATATATAETQADILLNLKLEQSAVCLQAPYLRSNLVYFVYPKKADMTSTIVRFINEHRGESGIVYCLTQRDSEKLAEALKSHGVSADFYHGKLGMAERNRKQELWMTDQALVMCTTIAFGMGVDKPNVRFIVHQTIPSSLEAYYQQTGRAVRHFPIALMPAALG